MDKETNSLERYKVAIEQVRHEGRILWQIFGAFLVVHSLFMAFLLQTAFDNDQAITEFRLGVFIASIAGMFLCIPWISSHSRSSAFYGFRMAQAREAEPKDWRIIAEDGQHFSTGETTFIGSKSYRIPWLGRMYTTKMIVPFLIGFFFLVYLLIFVLKGPWW